MGKVIVTGFSLSLDGFAAGPDQTIDDPLGKGGLDLHQWFFDRKTFPPIAGSGPDTDARQDALASRVCGAVILGRNMFGPVRGPWLDDDWKGWWGDSPPWQAPTFVLTHHRRDPVAMLGGTTFHFVTGGIHAALDRARAEAGDHDIRIGGGASTIRQYLTAGLIDEMHLAIVPILLGEGASLLAGLNLPALGFRVTDRAAGAHALHVTLVKSA